METIQISKKAYNRLMSKRRGDEALSTVILREVEKGDKKKSNKMSLREEFDMIDKTGTFYTRDEAYKILGLQK